MILKSHLCGIAVAYEDYGKREFDLNDRHHNTFSDNQGRPQGSLYSQQKRKIADACEFMRLNAMHKPIIFVATSPGFLDHANEKQLISKLTHNLRNGYKCNNYVWVREFTQRGYPHFHFVADMPRFNAVDLSMYWSNLFGESASNSIRLGTAPNKNGKRNYYLTTKQMSWYLTKYLGKAIGNEEKGAIKGKRSFRTFAVSQELSKASEPVIYQSKMVRRATDRKAFTMRGYEPVFEDDRLWISDKNELTDAQVNNGWTWRHTGFNETYKGYPKQWKIK